MTAARGIGWARGIGFVLGVSLAISAVLGWRIPRGTGRLGADVAVAFLQTGTLQQSSVTPLINANDLQPGGAAAAGTVDVRNSSASTLTVRVKAEPSITDLDPLLWIDVRTSGRSLYRGTLGELRDGSRAFTISPLQTRTIEVRTWLPTDASTGYDGRIDEINLTFREEVVDR